MTASRELRVVDDADEVAAAGWVTEDAGGGTVGAILPPTFAAYARLLHPAYLTSGGRTRPVRWSGRIAASTQFEDVAAAADVEGEYLAPPVQGSMPPEVIPALLRVLARHTRTAKTCWFAVWEGFSGVRVRDETALRLVAPDRRFVLLRGALADAATNLDRAGFQTSNLWWPDDRAWVVATDIDHVSTFVAGGEACVADLLADGALQAMRVGIGDRIL